MADILSPRSKKIQETRKAAEREPGRMPRVFLRNGYAMIETGNGTARMIDPESDGQIIRELEIRMPEETMSKLRSALFELNEPIASTPLGLLGARLKLKNFTTNGKAAQGYVKSLPGDWKVHQLGDNEWDFAVSKDGVTWHLFDPGPFEHPKGPRGFLEFGFGGGLGLEQVMDLLDLTSDAIIGIGTVAAFSGGLVAGAPAGPAGSLAAGSAAGGATATGLEGIKQIIGQALGIQDNIDVSDAVALGVITTAFSGAGPTAARGIRAVGGRVKKLVPQKLRESIREALLEAGAGLAGIGGSGSTLRPERVLERRIADRAGIFKEIPGVDKTASAMRRLVQTTGRQQIPEQQLAAEIEQKATATGVTVNIREMVDDILTPLTEETVERAGKFVRVPRTKAGALKKLSASEALSSKVQKTIDNIDEIINLDASDARAVPITTAVEIKRALQALMKDRQVFRDAPTKTGRKAAEGETQFDKVLREFSAVVRKNISSKIDDVGIQATDGSQRLYSQVQKDFSEKMDQLSRWKFWLGANLPDEEGQKVASTFLRNLHKSGNLGFREAAASLKASTGLDIIKHAERAMTAELFGEQGVAKIFPRISAVGEPVGTGLGKRALVMGTAGLAGGLVTGGPGGAIAGGLLGGTASSEAGQLMLARNAPRLAGAVAGGAKRAVDALERSTNAKTLTLIQSVSRQLLQQKSAAERAADFERRLREAAEGSQP